MFQDLTFALRSLRRDAGASVLAILLLATGAGAAAAVFGIVDAYLLRPLPYPESDRIVSVRVTAPEGHQAPRSSDLAAVDLGATGVLSVATSWDLDVFTLIGGDAPERASGAWVDPAYFRVLGVSPALGRPLEESDLRSGGANVAVISHGLWQHRFGGDPNVLGVSFQAYVSDRPEEAESFTIVGVMGADFWPFVRYSEILAPLRAKQFPYLARLAPGADVAAASEALTTLVRAHFGETADPTTRVDLQPLHERYTAPIRPLLRVLLAAAVLVLLIAAGNVALLLFVRAGRRERELAVRAALGAGRDRLVRQLVFEGLAVAATAAILGLVIAESILGSLGPLISDQIGRATPGGATALRLDAGGALILLIVCSMVGVGLGLVASLVVRRADLGLTLRAGPGTTDTRERQRTRQLLVASEVALSLGLLVAAGLATRSALHLGTLALGFETDRILTTSIGLRAQSYPQDEDRVRFGSQFLERLAAAPAVSAAALATLPPFAALTPQRIEVAGEGGSQEATGIGIRSISSGYLSTLAIPLLAGRAFDDRDRQGTAPVAMVSADLARRLWPQSSPLGQRLRLGGSAMEMAIDGDGESPWREVIGVTGAVRETLVGEDLGEVYVPLDQSPSLWLTAITKSAGSDPYSTVGAVQSVIRDLDRGVPLVEPGPLTRHVERETLSSRFLAGVLSAFSVFAVVLGLVGLWGVVAHSAIQRRRETAIRLALGAEPRGVVGLFLRQAALTLGGGTALGLVVAWMLARALAGQLHGIGIGDAATWVGLPALLLLCAIVATWLPAHRASRCDPMTELRRD